MTVEEGTKSIEEIKAEHPSVTDLKDKIRLAEESGLYDTRLNFARSVESVFEEAQELLLSKHRDYGAKNISLSPGGALNGLRVRMHDKLARINNLYEGLSREGSGSYVAHESLRDSFVDLANYALIGALVLDERWPSE